MPRLIFPWVSTPPTVRWLRSRSGAQRQPVVPRLNPFSSLTAGLSDVWVGSSRAVTVKKATRTTLVGSATDFGGGAGGFAARMTASGGANSGLKITDNADDLFGLGSANTIFVLRRCLDTTARNSLLFGYGNTPNGRILCHAPYVDGNMYFDYENATSGSGRLSVAYTKDTDIEALVFVAGPTKGREIWRRGARIAQDVGATAARTSNSSGWGIGSAITSDGTDNAEVYMMGVATREWTDAECASFCRNPWQLFVDGGPFAHLFSTVSAASDFTALLAESATLAEAISAVLGISAAATEEATLADGLDVGLGLGAAVTESMTLADAASLIYGLSAAVSEALAADAAQDASNSAGDFGASISDAAALSDSATSAMAAYAAISAALSLADAISGAMAASGSVSEASGLGDSAAVVLGLLSQASEAFTADSGADGALGVHGTAAEAAGLVDSTTSSLEAQVAITESMTLAELAVTRKGFARSIVEAMAVLETLRARLARAHAAAGARGSRPVVDGAGRSPRVAGGRRRRTDSSGRTRH